MRRNVWITSLAIAGFFAIMGVVYVISVSGGGMPDAFDEVAQETGTDSGPAEEEARDEREASVHDGREEASEASRALLQTGDSGSAVAAVQRALNALGYDLAVDGEYGMETAWFVKDFQMQAGLSGDGIYDTETESALNDAEQRGDAALEPGKAIQLQLPERIVTNPDDELVLVNKSRKLPPDYEPEELVEPDVPHVFQGENLPHHKLRPVAADALEKLFAQAAEEGLELVARSGYRSYETQVAVFARNEERKGTEFANKYSARAGESEHQTGLVMDVTSPDVDHELVTAFAATDEGKWLEAHAADFGFIVRYPQGKEDITGYEFEPWHLRYVGKEAAQAIMSQKITLEEYLLQMEENR